MGSHKTHRHYKADDFQGTPLHNIPSNKLKLFKLNQSVVNKNITTINMPLTKTMHFVILQFYSFPLELLKQEWVTMANYINSVVRQKDKLKINMSQYTQ